MKFSTAALTLFGLAASATAFVGPAQQKPFHVATTSQNSGSSLFMAATLESTSTTTEEDDATVMRPPINLPWDKVAAQLESAFGYTPEEIAAYGADVDGSKETLTKLYKAMQMARGFENACNQQYMQGKIRGFMHLDNGQESIPGLVDYAIKTGDKKFSYYREHTHAIASGVDPGAVMAELFMKDTGTCRGAGGSMHIFDRENYFQGGWALVCEQLPYAAGAAKSILLDRALGVSDNDEYQKQDVAPPADDDRIAVVFVGEGGAQNGRTAELLNAAAKDNLPILLLVIDNGRAINTFTPDIATNSNVYEQGKHYGIPGLLVDGLDAADVAKGGKAVIDAVVFVGEGGAQNGRTAELLNAAAKDNLPILLLVIDNGRAINTFTPDIATNSNVYEQGKHYGIPGLLVDGLDAADVAKGGKAVIDYIRKGKGPAILQVHTYRFNGHSPADPEHERGRKEEKAWARQEQDPIKSFEDKYIAKGVFTEEELKDARKEVLAEVKECVKFADESPMPPVELAKELEFPDKPDTDYNTKVGPAFADEVNSRTISADKMATIQAHIASLQAKADAGEISIGDAINLAIHEEMLRDPTTTIHAEDLQAGSSY
eukprot:CAMPEP_0113458860 /NCGR_PEP_ID=MMETSP0014_2-20120614/10142_1 /TAXON_ID=2857 /ORGANISM="Nitzschia sp." /LENGTH=601 /DNA_ID=CAMNT_0000350401 /DNA_START=144 /DNA_END=1946 /DNA_ORIENTATION=+ /assembly_acc=CAM_ASM_000159